MSAFQEARWQIYFKSSNGFMQFFYAQKVSDYLVIVTQAGASGLLTNQLTPQG